MGRFGGDINNSLAPTEKTMPYWEERRYPDNDPVVRMAQLWAEENVRQPNLNYGTIPLDFILHECNNKCIQYTKEGTSLGVQHHFTGEGFNEHDVRVVNATMRWLATMCGRGFLADFFREAVRCRIQPDPELRKTHKLQIEESIDNIS